MMKKNQKTRYTMEQAKTAFLSLKCWYFTLTFNINYLSSLKLSHFIQQKLYNIFACLFLSLFSQRCQNIFVTVFDLIFISALKGKSNLWWNYSLNSLMYLFLGTIPALVNRSICWMYLSSSKDRPIFSSWYKHGLTES